MTPGIDAVVERLAAYLAHERPGDLTVGFSGGPDSTALLLGLAHRRTAFAGRLVAVHIDHRMDPESSTRAAAAGEIARGLGVPFAIEVLDPVVVRRHDGGMEAGARVERYRALARRAETSKASVIVTAHHADDQAETVLLRWMQGTGWRGLGAIDPVRGRIHRPLLSLTRATLRDAVTESGITPLEDPGNRDTRRRRNFVRQHLMPRLEAATPDLRGRLVRVARHAAAARHRIDRRLARSLDLETTPLGPSLDRRRFEALPESLHATGLALLHRRAGIPYPPGTAATAELRRQLDVGRRVACDCGAGWRWTADRNRLRLVGAQPDPGYFTYTLEAPGRIELPAIGSVLDLREAAVGSWMFEHRPRQAAFAACWSKGTRLTVRARRPGDRIRPLGSPGRRRLKDVLIDRRVPRAERDRIPLLTIDDDIIWVPGVTLEHRFRITDQRTAWVARLTPRHTGTDSNPDSRNL